MINLFNNIEDVPNDGVYKETETGTYTNKTNIPEYLADRLIQINETSYGGDKEPNTISATMFTGSIKQIIFHLERAENYYKIPVDVADLIKSVQGSMLHENYLVPPGEADRQFIDVLGYKISGGADRITYGDNKVLVEGDDLSILNGQSNIKLRDIKTTSSFVVSKLIKEMKLYKEGTSLSDLKATLPTVAKYVIQLSIYNLLYKLNVNIGYLDFIIMNWSPMDRSTIGEMVQEYEIPIYSAEDTLEFVTDIVEKVIAYRKSGFKPDCSELVTSGKAITEYKLVRFGKTRRVAGSQIYSTREEAMKEIGKFPGTVITEIKPKIKPVLCTQYCEFNIDTVCKQGTRLKHIQGL